MELNKLRTELIGKKLLTIISLDINDTNSKIVRNITNDNYHSSIDSIQMLLFENNNAIAFVDFDCDGYRSGDWLVIKLNEILDKGNTNEIKNINSIVRDICYIDTERNDSEYIIISTDAYIITMGQNNVSDYYPSNFFNIEECKKQAIKNVKEKHKSLYGEVVDVR